MTPTENDTNSPRVNRGGSWYNDGPWWVRAPSRVTGVPADRNRGIGFRTSLPARQPR